MAAVFSWSTQRNRVLTRCSKTSLNSKISQPVDQIRTPGLLQRSPKAVALKNMFYACSKSAKHCISPLQAGGSVHSSLSSELTKSQISDSKRSSPFQQMAAKGSKRGPLGFPTAPYIPPNHHHHHPGLVTKTNRKGNSSINYMAKPSEKTHGLNMLSPPMT